MDILPIELRYSLRACLISDDNRFIASLQSMMNINQPSPIKNNIGGSGGGNVTTMIHSRTSEVDCISMSSFVIMLCTCAMLAFPMETETRRISRLFDILHSKIDK